MLRPSKPGRNLAHPTRLYRFQRVENHGGQGRQVFELVRSRADQNNRNPAADGGLLMRYALVDSQQDVVSRSLSRSEQVSVLPAFQSSPFSRVRFVGGKAVPEVDWQAFIQKNLHAIFASRESFASSSDFTAISRVTEGNCRRNSPNE